jgi:ferrochelatase
VARAVGLRKFELAYQSGRRGWLGPTVSETIRKLAGEGRANIVVVPLSFTCDNIETLCDIDIELKAQADELGVKLRRTESLNDSPEFIAALADIALSPGARQEE